VVQAFLEVMALEVRESEDQPTSRSVITP